MACTTRTMWNPFFASHTYSPQTEIKELAFDGTGIYNLTNKMQ